MNLKQLKLNRLKSNAGFTLVELIVVIAILAILGGIGVPAYSGYVKNANKTADETLLQEIRQALILASYESELASGDMVKVTKDGATAVSGNPENQTKIESAMEKAFGSNWQEICALKYEGWDAAATEIIEKYKDTSLYGKEEELLKTMNHLSGEMFTFFGSVEDPEKLPEEIKNILKEQNIPLSNSTAVANGAVLALAQTLTPEKLTGTTYTKDGETISVEAGIKQALVAVQNPDSLAKKDGNGNYLDEEDNIIDANNTGDRVYQFGGVGADLLNAYGAVYEDTNMALLASAATLYAYAESYAQYAAAQENPNNKPMEILRDIDYSDKSASEIYDEIKYAFGDIMKDAMTYNGGPIANAWIANQANKDDTALLTVLDALNDSSEAFKDNLTSDTFYSDGTAAGLVDAYLGVGSANLGHDEAAAIISGTNDVQVYLGGLRS